MSRLRNVVILVVTLAIAGAFYLTSDFVGTSGKPPESEILKQLHPKGDSWSVITANLDAPLAALAIQGQARSVTAAIERYKSLSAMQPVAAKFSGRQFRSTVVQPDRNVIAAEPVQFGIDPLICVVPQQSAQVTESSASFDRNAVQGGCLVLRAIKWGDQAWQDAVEIHELFHYAKFLDKAPSAFAATGSDLYNGEEAEAHVLESRVLNAATQGRYDFALVDVFNRNYKPNVWETMKSAAPEVASQVDSLFLQPTYAEASLRGGQYEFEIIRKWYARRGNKDPDQPAYKLMRFGDQ